MHAPRSVRPTRLLATTLLAAALALAGCSSADNGASDKSAGNAKAAAPGAQRQGAADSSTGSGAKGRTDAPKINTNRIIRTASLTVQVKDVPKALGEARTSAENAGGFVGDESTSRDAEGHEHTRLVLRVPSEKYDEVLAELQGAGKLVDRTAKAEDVTDQVVDVDSRIKSQQASVARVRELMDKATRLSDVVALEGELSSREADLEALLAQQASLKNRTSLATITLSLSEKPVAKEKKDDQPGFVDALAGSWHVFVTLLRWIALAIGAALPFVALAGLLMLGWTRLVRRRLSPRTAPAAPANPGPENTGQGEGP
ncbi:MAG: DUF4349 domain-containing protein [Streptomyces sp.]|jgi:hypothetical protein|nr:DUF4349 domain-containing protein [Streptomyces sp.]